VAIAVIAVGSLGSLIPALARDGDPWFSRSPSAGFVLRFPLH